MAGFSLVVTDDDNFRVGLFSRHMFISISDPPLSLSTGARLTADNVVRILQQVIVPERLELKKWKFTGRWILEISYDRFILHVSYDKRKEITSTCTTDEQRLQVMVTFWLQKCSYASWRYLIWRLEQWHNPDLSKQIYGFAEPLTGMM